MADTSNNALVCLKLVLELLENSLEVFLSILDPLRDVVAESAEGKCTECTLFNEVGIAELVCKTLLLSSHLSVVGFIKERTDFDIFEVSKGITHHISVIGKHVDVTCRNSVRSLLDSYRGVESGTRLRHNSLKTSNFSSYIERSVVESVRSLTSQADMSNDTVNAHNGDRRSVEVNCTDNFVLESLFNVALSVLYSIRKLLLHKVMSCNVEHDRARKLILFRVLRISHDYLEDEHIRV